MKPFEAVKMIDIETLKRWNEEILEDVEKKLEETADEEPDFEIGYLRGREDSCYNFRDWLAQLEAAQNR